MTIYYLCPDNPRPAGGVRAIYRHVDILNANGYQAAVVHERRGFRAAWFPNETRIVSWARRPSTAWGVRSEVLRRGGQATPERPYVFMRTPPDLSIGDDDVLVVPEIMAHAARQIVGDASRFVLLNQHAYVIFRRLGAVPAAVVAAYRDPRVLGVLVTSRDSREELAYVFPGLETHYVRYSVDTRVFRPDPRVERRRQIAYMPRRGGDDASHVLGALAARGSLAGVATIAIDGLDEDETAATLQQSLVFMAISYQEGFGLPPAEAMACGCIVAGYDALGGREYFDPDLVFRVPIGHVGDLARTVERILADDLADPESLRSRAAAGAAFIAREYSPERQEHDVLAAWSALLGS